MRFLTNVEKSSFILQATTLPEIPTNTLGDLEIEQLRSVIYGLLRQNSFTFLEVLEEGSIAAIKSTFRDVAKQVLAPEEQDATLTNIVADLAKKAKSKEWLSFFDLLLGSLISLLRRIHSIHNVIMEAIETANEASNTATDPISIPEQQLAAIKVSLWIFAPKIYLEKTRKSSQIHKIAKIHKNSQKFTNSQKFAKIN